MTTRWSTTPLGAQHAVYSAMCLVDILDRDNLTEEEERRVSDFLAVLDEHFTFEQVEG